MRIQPAVLALASLAASVAVAPAPAGSGSNDGEAVGLTDLLNRIGPQNLPTGAGIIVGHVEAPDGQGDYGPNPADAEFAGKSLLPMNGPTGPSTHATVVGSNFYGLQTSIAPGIDVILNWDVNLWATGSFLRTSSGSLPAATPPDLKVFNHSWIGEFGSAATDNNALRRADFVMLTDDVLMVSAVDNDEINNKDDGRNLALLGHAFNGLSTGVSDGTHTTDDSLASIDGPGRQLPHIVAPGNKVSWAAPVIAASAALMIETARSTPSLAGDPFSERGEVVKALLMAGTDHRDAWTNDPATSGPGRGTTSRPLDDVVGADEVNVNTSHLVLTTGRQPGAAAPPAGVTALHAGWDLAGVALDGSRYWRFSVCGSAETLSVVATWHRRARFPFGNGDWSVADFDLELWRVDAQGQLTTLVGKAGLGWFASGNVRSTSRVDNVEHLFVRGLAPGEYAVELRRVDAVAAEPTWDAAVAWHVTPTAAPGDLDQDCTVGVGDLLGLLAAWGPCPDPCPVEPCPADLNGDCVVDTVDFLELLANWE